MEDGAFSQARKTRRIVRVRLSDAMMFPTFAVLAGIIDALLLLGWHDMSPSNLDWLRGDPAVYQAGWEFLRHTPWAFPLTWIGRLDYPFGISAAYLDVIPIVAISLRWFSGVLPANFQYLGAYATLCLILQTYFGLKLLSRFTSDRVFLFIGALFFLNAPILLSRLSGHFSLCSQWLIVAALYHYFAPVGTSHLSRYILPFAVLLAVAGGITPYLAVMVFGVSTAALFRWFSLHRTKSFAHAPDPFSRKSDANSYMVRPDEFPISLLYGILCFAVLLLVMVGAFFVFGFLATGASTQLSGGGYTGYSMNLLGPINPVNAAWPLKAFDVLPGQDFEGYDYLGIGVIALGFICLARRPGLLAILASPSVRPILAACALLTFVALSARITIGDSTLIVLPLPRPVLHLLAVFRSSGRFSWPMHYLIILGVITGALMAFSTRSARCAVLGAALLIQYHDILPVRGAVSTSDAARYASPLRAAVWSSVGMHHKHLILLPAWQCDQLLTPGGDLNWADFARLAARSGMTLNSTHAARDSMQSDAYNCIWLPQHVLRGEFADDTAYVLSNRFALMAIEHDTTHYCREVDGFNLCTFNPVGSPRSHLLGLKILPPLVIGAEFRADRAIPGDFLLDGWDTGPYPAIWTIGRNSSIYFRPERGETGDLLLEFRLGGYGALLTPRHRVQRAIVHLNGESIGTMSFAYRGNNAERTILIPGRLLRDGQVAQIRLDLPDAASPHDLGLSDDGRLLGIYVSRIRIVRAQGPQDGLPK